jgi:ABC-type polysaccharide/polyol phosphate export permease
LNSKQLKTAINDLRASLKMLPMAFHFAWGDTRARYRRSVLGPFWIVLGTAIGVAGLGYLWSAILKVDQATFIPSLTIGLVVWQFVSGGIVEAPAVFVRYAQTIRNIPTPFLIYPMQLMMRQWINFGHNLIVVAVVMLLYVRGWSAVQLLFFPGILLVTMNLLWISAVLALLGARFRDLDPLIGAVMPMLFFLSPVIYRPEHLPFATWIVSLNPMAYFIAAIRDPLQGTVPPALVYFVLVGMAIGGWFLTLRLYEYRRSRIPFWI